jgi:hypothetical protein
MSKFRTLLICIAAMSLAGCGETGKIFGFERSAPDEFTVVRNQPLSMPPNATLRPPEPGATQQTRDLSTNRARDTLLTSAPDAEAAQQADPSALVAAAQYPQQAEPSQGEVALVRRVTAYYGTEPDIRRLVDQESRRLALEQKNFLYTVLFWKDPPEPGTPLDASAESKRLRENEALGKPINSGVAPLIVRKKSGISGLF